MTYAAGQKITAADLNAMLTTARNVYGTGSGDRGYGQTDALQADVSANTPILATQYMALRQMVLVCGNHQGTNMSSLMGAVGAGQQIVASDTLGSYVTSIDTDRLVAAVGSMSLSSSAYSVTRATTWTGSISTTVSAVFASENHARYFFNSGGQIRIRFGHPNGSNTCDAGWRTIFGSRLTMYALKATSSAATGTASSYLTANTGFYGLTDSSVAYFNGQNIGGDGYGGYTAGGTGNDDVIIQAKRLNYVGLNGGNGSGVQFTVTLNDATATTVAAGTVVYFDVYRATTHLSGISTPVFTTVSGL